MRETPARDSAPPSTHAVWPHWWVAAVALLALRLPHLSGPLDDPHSWRQCDTAHYSLDFARRGLDLLHPAVCWLGAHRTLALEFPLPEALSALLGRAFGVSPMWDRLVSLGFFVLATFYFHRIVRRIAGARPAALATLAWLAFPLGVYFSRAAVVDFAATAFAHGLLDHGLVACTRRSGRHVAAAALCGALAAAIKTPDVLPVVPPLLLATLAAPSLAAWLGTGAALAASAIAFLLWRRHADAVNAAAPDWSFLPGYYREVNALWWYVGSLGQRFEIAGWVKVARRVVLEVATVPGALLALTGALNRARPEERPAWTGGPGGATPRSGPSALAFGLAWGLGVLLYLIAFFPLNVIHDYYQIPFLAPVALFAGLGGDLLIARLPRLGRLPLGAALFALFLLWAAWAPRPLGYYRVDWLRVEAGRAIAARVPEGELLVASDYGAGYSDPRLLFRAGREGWSLANPDLTPPILARLRLEGALWLAVVSDPGHPGLEPPAFLEPALAAREPIRHAGSTLGTLGVYDLRRAPGPADARGGGRAPHGP